MLDSFIWRQSGNSLSIFPGASGDQIAANPKLQRAILGECVIAEYRSAKGLLRLCREIERLRNGPPARTKSSNLRCESLLQVLPEGQQVCALGAGTPRAGVLELGLKPLTYYF